MAKVEAKLEFLRMVMEKKNLLFGSFSDTLTKADKTSAWKKIHERAQALALVPENKDFNYTRDTLWQNIKKTAMKKRDNSRATGTGGTNFTKVDHAVFDIIGKETPNMDGLTVSESMPLHPTIEITVDPIPTVTDPSPCIGLERSKNKENQRPQYKCKKQSKFFKEKEELQMKKLKLSVKLLKKENYLKRLKIMQLEQHLNIQPNNQNSSEDELEFEEEYLDFDNE